MGPRQRELDVWNDTWPRQPQDAGIRTGTWQSCKTQHSLFATGRRRKHQSMDISFNSFLHPLGLGSLELGVEVPQPSMRSGTVSEVVPAVWFSLRARCNMFYEDPARSNPGISNMNRGKQVCGCTSERTERPLVFRPGSAESARRASQLETAA